MRGHAPYKYPPRNKSPGKKSNPLRISWRDTSFSRTVYLIHATDVNASTSRVAVDCTLWMIHVTHVTCKRAISQIYVSHAADMNASSSRVAVDCMLWMMNMDHEYEYFVFNMYIYVYIYICITRLTAFYEWFVFMSDMSHMSHVSERYLRYTWVMPQIRMLQQVV